jgi:hypothetical protein
LVFYSHNYSHSEAMRLDASGNLLVGTTTAVGLGNGSSNEGISISSTQCQLIVATSDDTSLYLNRQTSDGSILEFRKDGSNVGSIQSRASLVSTFVLDPRSGGAGITSGGPILYPTNESGSLTNGSMDFGAASYRWKDLHLSGGVYLGGNKLDDYEEGTWTPTISSGTVTYTSQRGRYTKIGRQVYIHGFIQIASISGSSSTDIVSGLPFTAKADNNYAALASKTNGFDWGGSSTMITFQVVPNTTKLGAVGSGNNQAFRDINSSGLSANDWIAFTGSYVTDA